ncbi:hypothetical protein Sjap_026548 [Stephania japonica]|uniref:Uncharacterized protein n=1 Tax=Stephania japonica TaxID=461633 RepID=A0AAP0E789_9MAGN
MSADNSTGDDVVTAAFKGVMLLPFPPPHLPGLLVLAFKPKKAQFELQQVTVQYVGISSSPPPPPPPPSSSSSQGSSAPQLQQGRHQYSATQF